MIGTFGGEEPRSAITPATAPIQAAM